MQLTAKQTKKVYLPNDPDGAWVEIIYLKPGVRVLIEQEGNTMTASHKDGEFSPLLEMSRKAKRKMFFREVIESWGGFTDQHKVDLKPTMTNIEMVNREISTFHSWLESESDKFVAEIEKELDTAEEN